MKRNIFCAKKSLSLFLFTALFFINTISSAQPETSKLFLGKWITGTGQENAIQIGDNFYRASLAIYDLDSILYARMESQDADAFNISTDDVTVTGNKIKIFFKELDALYKAELNDNKNELRGTLAMTGKYISLSFKKIRMEQLNLRE
jgi:hypothetical protein